MGFLVHGSVQELSTHSWGKEQPLTRALLVLSKKSASPTLMTSAIVTRKDCTFTVH